MPFAFTLLAILGTHEFGHYFTARYHGASVSLPYFIPAPPPLFLFGTLGAVIRMRSPARDRNSLFDIAVAGPLAGLVVAVPALLLGLSLVHGWACCCRSTAGSPSATRSLMRLLTWLVFGSIPPGMDVFVHPVALAGWVGLFVTALNLFPVGQLDGGRIAYALFGPWHRQVSIATFVGLLALGAVFRVRELDRLRRPDPAPDGLPPPAAARRPHPGLAPPLRPRRRLPHPPDPPHPPRPDQLTGSGLAFRHLPPGAVSSSMSDM